MLQTVATTVALGTFGADLCFKTLQLTCSKSIDLITYFATTVHPSFEEFNTLLVKYDLKVQIRNIGQVVTELSDLPNLKQSIKMAISDLSEAIGAINRVLDQAKKAQEYQSTLYFNTWSWRRYDCSTLLKDLQLHYEVLGHRFDDLERIITISTLTSEKKIECLVVPA